MLSFSFLFYFFIYFFSDRTEKFVIRIQNEVQIIWPSMKYY